MANKEHLRKLKKGKKAWNQWRQEGGNVDLTEADLIKYDFSGYNLTNVNFNGADLSGADLSGAQLVAEGKASARFVNAKLKGAKLMSHSIHTNGIDFSGADCTNAYFQGTSFHNCKFTNTNFTGAVFNKARFGQNNEFSLANFTNAHFEGANFDRVNVEHVNFKNADFSKAILRATVDYADFTNAKGLYGRHEADVNDVSGAENAKYGGREPSWHHLRFVGSLPLFGISYIAIIIIYLWTIFYKEWTMYILKLQEMKFPLAEKLPELPMPKTLSLTFLAIVLLAIATTIYKFVCPDEIKEYSETRWIFELNRPQITYKSLAYSNKTFRWITFIAYCLAGLWIIPFLLYRIASVLIILFSSLFS